MMVNSPTHAGGECELPSVGNLSLEACSQQIWIRPVPAALSPTTHLVLMRVRLIEAQVIQTKGDRINSRYFPGKVELPCPEAKTKTIRQELAEPHNHIKCVHCEGSFSSTRPSGFCSRILTDKLSHSLNLDSSSSLIHVLETDSN